MQVYLEGRPRGPRSTCADVLFLVNVVAAAFVKGGGGTKLWVVFRSNTVL